MLLGQKDRGLLIENQKNGGQKKRLRNRNESLGRIQKLIGDESSLLKKKSILRSTLCYLKKNEEGRGLLGGFWRKEGNFSRRSKAKSYAGELFYAPLIRKRKRKRGDAFRSSLRTCLNIDEASRGKKSRKGRPKKGTKLGESVKPSKNWRMGEKRLVWLRRQSPEVQKMVCWRKIEIRRETRVKGNLAYVYPSIKY